MLWGLLILASLVVLQQPSRVLHASLLPCSIVAVHLLVLGPLSENQPRYSYFVFYLAAIYAGHPWRDALIGETLDVRAAFRRAKSQLRRAPSWLAAYAAVIALVVGGHYAAAAMYDVYLVNFRRGVISLAPQSRVSLEEAKVRFGMSLRQNSLRIRHPAGPAESRQVSFAHAVVAKSAGASVLRLSIEKGPPLDKRGEPRDTAAGVFRGAPGRSVSLLLDGRESRQIDLSARFDPIEISVAGIEPGPHQLELVFRFGDAAMGADEVETLISYLGIY